MSTLNSPTPSGSQTLQVSKDKKRSPSQVIFETSELENSFTDSSSVLFSLYLSHAEKHDKELTDSWKAGADGILVFTGLFATAVASFVIDSYKSLLPDTAGNTVKLLTQISNQLDGLSNGTRASIEAVVSPQSTSQPPASAIVVNMLWFTSLVISLFCALLATLQQRWARQYFHLTQPHVAIHKRARIRSFFAEGVDRFHVVVAVEAIPALLHVSVFLFLAGLVVSAFNIHHTVAYTVLASTAVCALVYLVITVLPAIYHDSPYTSPFSSFVWILSRKLLTAISCTVHRVVAFFTAHGQRNKASTYKTCSFKDMTTAAHHAAANLNWEIDARALGWTLDKLDEDGELMQFAAGIPGFSCTTEVNDPVKILRDAPKQSTLHRELYQPLVLLFIRASKPGLLRGSKLVPESERERCKEICLKALYFLPGAINLILTRLADPNVEKPGKVESGLSPIIEESRSLAKSLSKQDNRIDEGVRIGAQCVAAVAAAADANPSPRSGSQIGLPDNNRILEILNDFLDKTALQYIGINEIKEKKGRKRLEDKDIGVVLVTLRLIVKHLKAEPEGVAEGLRTDFEKLRKRIETRAGESLGIASENAERLLSELKGLFPEHTPTLGPSALPQIIYRTRAGVARAEHLPLYTPHTYNPV